MPKTTRVDGHTHTYTKGAKFTSTVNKHRHSVLNSNGKITIGTADGHKHGVSSAR